MAPRYQGCWGVSLAAESARPGWRETSRTIRACKWLCHKVHRVVGGFEGGHGIYEAFQGSVGRLGCGGNGEGMPFTCTPVAAKRMQRESHAWASRVSVRARGACCDMADDSKQRGGRGYRRRSRYGRTLSVDSSRNHLRTI